MYLRKCASDSRESQVGWSRTRDRRWAGAVSRRGPPRSPSHTTARDNRSTPNSRLSKRPGGQPGVCRASRMRSLARARRRAGARRWEGRTRQALFAPLAAERPRFWLAHKACAEEHNFCTWARWRSFYLMYQILGFDIAKCFMNRPYSGSSTSAVCIARVSRLSSSTRHLEQETGV